MLSSSFGNGFTWTVRRARFADGNSSSGDDDGDSGNTGLTHRFHDRLPALGFGGNCPAISGCFLACR